jgi:hypothetical protein
MDHDENLLRDARRVMDYRFEDFNQNGVIVDEEQTLFIVRCPDGYSFVIMYVGSDRSWTRQLR